jgi:hypothetical protein
MLLDPNLGFVKNVILPLTNGNCSDFNSSTTKGMFRAGPGGCPQPILLES